jgi:adenylate kinase family enzyme
MDLQTIIFIGRSGCGKGTQAKKMQDFLERHDKRKVFHLEAGERFRLFIQDDTYSSVLARRISDDGGLQPEFLSVWAWTGELINNVDKHDHLLIDGTPRRKNEALTLGSAFEFYNRDKIDVVYLNVSEDWSRQRLEDRGREDDKEISDVDNRMQWFTRDVVPVIDYYRAHRTYNFHEINGEQSIDKVHKEIIESIGLEDFLYD